MNPIATSWRPAQVRLAPAMGQQPIPLAPKPSVIDSPGIQAGVDLVAAVSLGILGRVFWVTRDSDGRPIKSMWSVVFWSMSAVMAFKGAIDVSRLYR
jgi:hypothetical protein